MALDDAKAMEMLPRAFVIRRSYPSLDPPSGSSQELHCRKTSDFLSRQAANWHTCTEYRL